LDAEDVIRKEIEATLAANHLNIYSLQSCPELNEAYDFVEQRATSTLQRWEQRDVVHALPLYLATRHRYAVDAMLFIFVRLARILRLRVQTTYDENLIDTNRVLFEHRGGELVALRKAVLQAIKSGNPKTLAPFRQLLITLEEQGEESISHQGYYDLMASRGTFTRKLAHRLKSIKFEGRDAHARSVVYCLGEVFRFAPFAEPVPRHIHQRLLFLDVSRAQLTNRRIFESVLLITLADMLWLGRVTSPQSAQFGNRWETITKSSNNIQENTIQAIIRKAKKDLRTAWDALKDPTIQAKVVAKSRLVTRRPPRKLLEDEEKKYQQAKQQFLNSQYPISIVDVLMQVHNSTGMLDAFQPSKNARRYLVNDQRVRLSLGVTLARGMNIGIVQMSTLLGRWYTLGRLQNFDDAYVTIPNLLLANKILLDCWDQRGLGKIWGQGHGVAADGRSVMASERNLLSGYHYRHRRSGVTLYWLVRDDWMAARVGVIGNHEWESWFLLDGLLNPIGGQAPLWSTGDMHGQHLALWGLAALMGKDIRARFRGLSHVVLYSDENVSRLPVRGVQRIRWGLIERAIPAFCKIVSALREGKITARDILRTWNLYDVDGMNVIEPLRELGKVVRTKFILDYAMSEDSRQTIREGCNRAETWNSFQEAVFWGHGGRIRTNDSRRQTINALSMMLIMNSIVFFNAEKHGKKLRKIEGSCPVTWEHIRLLGDYRITLSRRTVGRGVKN
jgi:TnpA family transposase